MSVIVLNHSMIKHKLTNIRRKETTTKDFYQNVQEIAGLMAFEISRDFPLQCETCRTDWINTRCINCLRF